MFVNLKNLANLESSLQITFFPSFLQNLTLPPKLHPSHTQSKDILCVLCKNILKLFIRLFQQRFLKSYFNTKENIEQIVLAKKSKGLYLQAIVATYSQTLSARADYSGAHVEC